MAAHANADQRNLDDISGGVDALGTHFSRQLAADFQRALEIIAVHSEREVGGAIGADVLHEHVDLDVGSADSYQDRGNDTGAVRHAGNGELGLGEAERDFGKERIFKHTDRKNVV